MAERVLPGRRAGCLLAGVAVAVLAVASPLDRAAESRLAWHMTQHLLLVSVAAPLLAAALPRRRLRAVPWAESTLVGAAAVVALAVLLVWHVPAMYDAALRREALHGVEHVTMLASSSVLWVQLVRAEHLGSSVLWLFLVTLPTTAFGVAMTIARTPWYPPYAARRSAESALRDQQMAGVVMWAFGGLAALAGAIVLFAAWLVRDARAPQLPFEGVTP